VFSKRILYAQNLARRWIDKDLDELLQEIVDELEDERGAIY